MSRSRPRTSRILLVILGLSVAAGVFFFVRQYRNNRADAANAAPMGATSAAVIAVPASALPDDLDAVITRTPRLPGPTPNGTATLAESAEKTGPTASSSAKGERPAASPAVALSSKPLADAKARADAGDLLAARDIYNAALLSEKLSPDETRAAKARLGELSETIVFSSRRFEADPWGGTFTVPPGGVLAKIAKRYDVTPELLARVNGISDPRRLRADQTIKVLKGPLHAVVDKSDFTLDLYFGAPGGPGSSYVTTYRVGLGKDDSTPTGKWVVEPGKKLANPTYYSPRGQGVIGPDDPTNPLGDFWIGLAGIDGQAVGKLSYGIHGTIEPDSIGTMASMGCIRLRNEDIARVYELLVEGKSTVLVEE